MKIDAGQIWAQLYNAARGRSLLDAAGNGGHQDGPKSSEADPVPVLHAETTAAIKTEPGTTSGVATATAQVING